MKIKTHYVIIFFCIIFVSVPIANTQSASTWYSIDDEDDVEFYDNDVKQSTGDYRNEIDVKRVELNGNYIVIFTQDQPMAAIPHVCTCE